MTGVKRVRDRKSERQRVRDRKSEGHKETKIQGLCQKGREIEGKERHRKERERKRDRW